MSENPYGSATEAPIDQQPQGRPLAITLLCLIGIACLVLVSDALLTRVLPAVGARRGDLMKVYVLIAWLLTIVALIGYWRMAKWSVWMYGGLCVIGLALHVSTQEAISLRRFSVQAAILGIGLFHYKRMQWHAEEWRLSRGEFPWLAVIAYFFAASLPFAVLYAGQGYAALLRELWLLPLFYGASFVLAAVASLLQCLMGHSWRSLRNRFNGALCILCLLLGFLWIVFACMGYSVEFAASSVPKIPEKLASARPLPASFGNHSIERCRVRQAPCA